MVDEFPGLFLIVIVVFFNRSGIWKVSGKFLDFLSAIDFERTCFVFHGFDFKIFCFFFKSSSHSCHAQPVSKGLSGMVRLES